MAATESSLAVTKSTGPASDSLTTKVFATTSRRLPMEGAPSVSSPSGNSTTLSSFSSLTYSVSTPTTSSDQSTTHDSMTRAISTSDSASTTTTSGFSSSRDTASSLALTDPGSQSTYSSSTPSQESVITTTKGGLVPSPILSGPTSVLANYTTWPSTTVDIGTETVPPSSSSSIFDGSALPIPGHLSSVTSWTSIQDEVPAPTTASLLSTSDSSAQLEPPGTRSTMWTSFGNSSTAFLGTGTSTRSTPIGTGVTTRLGDTEPTDTLSTLTQRKATSTSVAALPSSSTQILKLTSTLSSHGNPLPSESTWPSLHRPGTQSTMSWVNSTNPGETGGYTTKSTVALSTVLIPESLSTTSTWKPSKNSTSTSTATSSSWNFSSGYLSRTITSIPTNSSRMPDGSVSATNATGSYPHGPTIIAPAPVFTRPSNFTTVSGPTAPPGDHWLTTTAEDSVTYGGSELQTSSSATFIRNSGALITPGRSPSYRNSTSSLLATWSEISSDLGTSTTTPHSQLGHSSISSRVVTTAPSTTVTHSPSYASTVITMGPRSTSRPDVDTRPVVSTTIASGPPYPTHNSTRSIRETDEASGSSGTAPRSTRWTETTRAPSGPWRSSSLPSRSETAPFPISSNSTASHPTVIGSSIAHSFGPGVPPTWTTVVTATRHNSTGMETLPKSVTSILTPFPASSDPTSSTSTSTSSLAKSSTDMAESAISLRTSRNGTSSARLNSRTMTLPRWTNSSTEPPSTTFSLGTITWTRDSTAQVTSTSWSRVEPMPTTLPDENTRTTAYQTIPANSSVTDVTDPGWTTIFTYSSQQVSRDNSTRSRARKESGSRSAPRETPARWHNATATATSTLSGSGSSSMRMRTRTTGDGTACTHEVVHTYPAQESTSIVVPCTTIVAGLATSTSCADMSSEAGSPGSTHCHSSLCAITSRTNIYSRVSSTPSTWNCLLHDSAPA
ncbi:hypothetical protein DCS_01077 [Drechmeria coniospora]|uniref:Uncharacterized protein n=1 Tax=Drechmeria coniospora TaxID=98403 RepID=A0A151GS96_DRECN|nr:hypothetical protein DCS_01077 [Drechmeria coniospora]KYK59943.1 hypothetical protein DCS_01077 [Drechmeria coniospora]